MTSQVYEDSFSEFFEPCLDDDELATTSFFDFYTDEYAAQDSESHQSMDIIILRSAKFISDLIHYDDPSVLQTLQSIVAFFELDAETFLLALITFSRYIKYNIETLDIEQLSQVVSIFVNCIILAQKALEDTPIYQAGVAEALNLKLSDMIHEQLEIFKSIGSNMFYTRDDIRDLDTVFPIEGLLQLSYSVEKPIALEDSDYEDEYASTEVQFEESLSETTPHQELPVTPRKDHMLPSSPASSVSSSAITLNSGLLNLQKDHGVQSSPESIVSSSAATLNSGLLNLQIDSDLETFSDEEWDCSPDTPSNLNLEDMSPLNSTEPIYIRT